MRPKTNGTMQRVERLNNIQGEGPNWILIAGGALLSTFSIRLGCKLKQALDRKQANNAVKENVKVAGKRRLGACRLHSNLYCFNQDAESCYHCLSGISQGSMDMKQAPASPMSKEADISLPLVKISAPDSNKENAGVMWASSPDRLELPPKPFHHSNSSDSPCVSESGSDIYTKREVIHKLRQQLKRRDDMIMEMQAQITDLDNTLSVQMAHSTNLQSRLDSLNQNLFDSQREIQRLRKVIADHCVAESGSPQMSTSVRNWQAEVPNGHANGYHGNMADLELHYVGVDKGRGDEERVEMLKREVGELKEVIEGKDFLLQSYKEQKVELCSKINELQLKLDSQVPNIL